MNNNLDRTITVRLSAETLSWVEGNLDGKSNSDRIRRFLESERVRYKYLQRKKIELTKELEKIEKLIKENIWFEEYKPAKEEGEWIKDAIKKIEDNEEVLPGLMRFYNNYFGRHLSLAEFKEFINKHGCS